MTLGGCENNGRRGFIIQFFSPAVWKQVHFCGGRVPWTKTFVRVPCMFLRLCCNRHLERELESKVQIAAIVVLYSGTQGSGTLFLTCCCLPLVWGSSWAPSYNSSPACLPSASPAPVLTSAGRSCRPSWRFGGGERSTQVPVCHCGFLLFLMDSSLSLPTPFHIHLSFLKSVLTLGSRTWSKDRSFMRTT